MIQMSPQTSQFKILQGILSKEAASRVHLEDSLSRLNMDNTALREQFSAAQSKLSGFQTREAELKARLEAAQDTISQMREASERERRSQDLQRERAAQSHEWTRAYARMTIEAQHSLLACILAPSRSLNVPDLVGDWTFETCLGPDHPITNEATMEYLTVMQDEWVVDVQGMRA